MKKMLKNPSILECLKDDISRWELEHRQDIIIENALPCLGIKALSENDKVTPCKGTFQSPLNFELGDRKSLYCINRIFAG